MIMTELTFVDWAVMHPYLLIILAFIVCGTVILMFNVTLNVAYQSWTRGLRSRNIRQHGWPPAHCDADGDMNTAQLDSLAWIVEGWLSSRPPTEEGSRLVRAALLPIFGTATEEVLEAALRVRLREEERSAGVVQAANVSRVR